VDCPAEEAEKARLVRLFPAVPAGQKPLFKLGVLQIDTPIVVDFINLIISGSHPEIITVTALPPFPAVTRDAAEAAVRPGFFYLGNDVFPPVHNERDRVLYLTLCSDLNILTDEL